MILQNMFLTSAVHADLTAGMTIQKMEQTCPAFNSTHQAFNETQVKLPLSSLKSKMDQWYFEAQDTLTAQRESTASSEPSAAQIQTSPFKVAIGSFVVLSLGVLLSRAARRGSTFAICVLMAYHGYIWIDHFPFLFTSGIYKTVRLHVMTIGPTVFWLAEAMFSVASYYTCDAPVFVFMNAPNHIGFIVWNTLKNGNYTALLDWGSEFRAASYAIKELVSVGVVFDTSVHSIIIYCYLKKLLGEKKKTSVWLYYGCIILTLAKLMFELNGEHMHFGHFLIHIGYSPN